MNYLQMLLRYKAWANDLLLSALSELPEGEIVSPRPIVFGSIIRTLNHVYVMDQVWQAHLQGKTHQFSTRNPDQCPELAKLRASQHHIDRWYAEYADSLSEQDLTQVVEFKFIGGELASMTRGEILLHVVNHATYHRGHVADMMYQISAQPPVTDLPVFLRRDGA